VLYSAPVRIAITAPFLVLFATLIPSLSAADGGVAVRPISPFYIVVGFTGGFVRHDNPHQGPVQLAQRIRREVSAGTYVQVFENRHRKKAYQTILRLLDSDHNGSVSDEEKARAHVILYGHSWGASAVVLLARELDRAGVPVLLTVQVDSVAKLWQRDDVIPANVSAAVNFYQPHGLVHGRAEIRAEDDSKTQILGNYRFDYSKNPVQCEGISWFDRTFTASHVQSECDSHLWTQIEGLMLQRIEPPPGVVAANPRS
jgi:hypothetical protein